MITSAEYRTLPESNDSDMREDITDFWSWIRGDLQFILSTSKPGLKADLEKIIAWVEV